VNARSKPLSAGLPRGSTPGTVRAVEVVPITDADVQTVAQFLERGMSSGVSAADWRRAMTPPWNVEQPNHGYFLRANGHVVGAYLAFYSERVIEGYPQRICNLGAWCVADEYRASGLRLLRSLLRQRGYTFTDLSPSGNVVALNLRFGFTPLDSTTAVVPNLPWPVRSRGMRVVDAPDEIDELLSGRDLEIYLDHAATAAAHHVVLVDGERSCYVVFRRERRKRLPLFASILHVGDPDMFRSCAPLLYRHLLLRHGIPVTRAEVRVVGHRPTRGLIVSGRSRMYLSEDLGADQIDYLYSELTCVAW
jgi:hypothetical protein